MTSRQSRPALLGYSDVMSARPGETISFKVSSRAASPFYARLVRSISADPNPKGAGIIEVDASDFFSPAQFPSVEQPFFPGSYGLGADVVQIGCGQSLGLSATIFPTLICENPQSILGIAGIDLALDAELRVVLRQDGTVIATGPRTKLRQWVRLSARVTTGRVDLVCEPIDARAPADQSSAAASIKPISRGRPIVAARFEGAVATDFFNGKIEAPVISRDDAEIAAWDFSKGISSTTGHAIAGPDLRLVNYPTRATTGADWDASEMNWAHKPEHYAAIHFHQDDIYDFEWETSFTFTLPHDMPSGIYVMRLECDGAWDAIPFFVTRPLGQPSAKLCVLVSTFTYVIYGNHARLDYSPAWKKRASDWGGYPHNPINHKEYGLSTYNNHADGSGICHASHRRPLFNLRPGYVTFGDTPCSGLRHFQADSHLISWLHAKGIDYDIVTDAELHRDGADVLAGYDVVTTGSHPEYHTGNTLDALCAYRDSGGHLLYLGGNGFYWRIAVHGENKSLLEIRRAEDGIRAWAAEPGEYYNAFDGSYGGLWRRNARATQELVGVGFAAQGEFVADPFQRVCRDPEYDWVFEGIEEDILGNFGYSGGGAAGFELDHMDHRLGTPEDAVLLARSVTRENNFMLVLEEQLTHLTNLTGGPAGDALYADIVHFEADGGGSVFSAGSITFCGCLPWNNFDNNVSRLLENVVRRKLVS